MFATNTLLSCCSMIPRNVSLVATKATISCLNILVIRHTQTTTSSHHAVSTTWNKYLKQEHTSASQVRAYCLSWTTWVLPVIQDVGLIRLSKENLIIVSTDGRSYCGNEIVETGEQCDCGDRSDCHMQDPCCVAKDDGVHGCRLKSTAQCRWVISTQT